MLTPDALVYTFVIVTSVWQAQVPSLSLAECDWMVKSAPLVVAQQQHLGGYQIEFERATCIPEER